MYELIQVSEQSYYIQSPAKIGLVKLNKQDVCLIDSGNDIPRRSPIRFLLLVNRLPSSFCHSATNEPSASVMYWVVNLSFT